MEISSFHIKNTRLTFQIYFSDKTIFIPDVSKDVSIQSYFNILEICRKDLNFPEMLH